MPDFLPSTDSDLLVWAQNYSSLITATPTAYGLSAPTATTLGGYVDDYQAALAAATAGPTRGNATVLAKDNARATMVEYIRQTARQVQGTMSVTNEQRQDLGLTVRDASPSPIPPPDEAPEIDIVSVSGNTVRIRLHEAASTRRGKPAGVDGATVFSFVGAEAPTTESAWTFEGNTTKTVLDIAFPDTVAPGAKVWFTAFWFNERKESGPAATAVGTNLPGGGAMAA